MTDPFPGRERKQVLPGSLPKRSAWVGGLRVGQLIEPIESDGYEVLSKKWGYDIFSKAGLWSKVLDVHNNSKVDSLFCIGRMETGDTTSNCHAHICMYEHERAHVAQALVHHQREWACLKCESSCTHWHDWKPKTSMECGNVKYCKLRPHDMPQVFKSILPICWNIHFRKGLPCQHAGELRDSQCWPSFEVSLTGALPKDGRATCDRAGCECLPRRLGAVVALGLLGDPYPFWCTIYIGWFSLLGRQTERQACLLPRRFNGEGLSILSSGISLGHPKASQLDRFCGIAKLSCPDPKEPGRRYRIWPTPAIVGYTPIVNLCVRYPTFLPGSFPLTLTFKDSGLSGSQRYGLSKAMGDPDSFGQRWQQGQVTQTLSTWSQGWLRGHGGVRPRWLSILWAVPRSGKRMSSMDI